MKKIITHINPDLDAICSVWLIKKFLPASPNRGEPGWQEAKVEFVEATSSGEEMAGVDDNPNILYVDVGRGKLDHHQTNEYLSASKLVWDFIRNERKSENVAPLDEKAVERLVEVVTQIDNARDLNWKEVKKDRYSFYLHILIEGLRELSLDDLSVVKEGSLMLETILINLKNKIRAEEEMKQAIKFQTPWGKAVALKTGNKHFLYFGETQGYVLVMVKDPESGGVRIYARPDSKVDLSKAYDKVKKLDPQSDWFLHSSKRLLLNNASVIKMKPTKLSLAEIIEIIKERKIK